LKLSIANGWYVYLYRQHTSLPICTCKCTKIHKSSKMHSDPTHMLCIGRTRCIDHYTTRRHTLTLTLHCMSLHHIMHALSFTYTIAHHPLPHTIGLNGTDTYHQRALPYRSVSLSPHLPALCTGPSTVQRKMDPTHPRTCCDRYNYYIV